MLVGAGAPLLLAGRSVECMQDGAEVVHEDRALAVCERRGRPEIGTPRESAGRAVEGEDPAGGGDVDGPVDDDRSAVDLTRGIELPERSQLVRARSRKLRLGAVGVSRAVVVSEHRPLIERRGARAVARSNIASGQSEGT